MDKPEDFGQFRVVVADPPWKAADQLPGKRGAGHKYQLLSTPDIMRFPLPPMHDNCILFLWRLASMPQDALDVVRAWGFIPKSEIVWEKLTKTGKDHFGTGRYVRMSHETCIIALRAGGRNEPLNRRTRSRFRAPVPCDGNGRPIHSAKPPEFFQIVRSLYAGPRISMFERTPRDGFYGHGDQLGTDLFIPTYGGENEAET